MYACCRFFYFPTSSTQMSTVTGNPPVWSQKASLCSTAAPHPASSSVVLPWWRAVRSSTSSGCVCVPGVSSSAPSLHPQPAQLTELGQQSFLPQGRPAGLGATGQKCCMADKRQSGMIVLFCFLVHSFILKKRAPFEQLMFESKYCLFVCQSLTKSFLINFNFIIIKGLAFLEEMQITLHRSCQNVELR